MTPPKILPLVAALLALSLGALQPALADVEVRAPDGRRILLKDDGTWRALEEQEPPPAEAKPAEAKPPELPPERAELQLLRRSDVPDGCEFALSLSNGLPYEIRSLVPEFAVLRANGVVYTAQGRGFGPVKPGDTHQRDLRFLGITCADIAKLQVRGGDRCDMGELNKFTEPNGQCLARLRVLPSPLLPFEK